MIREKINENVTMNKEILSLFSKINTLKRKVKENNAYIMENCEHNRVNYHACFQQGERPKICTKCRRMVK